MEKMVPQKIEDPNRDVAEAIQAIPKMSPDVQKVMKLVEVLIGHLRKDNDTGTREEVLANQGGIAFGKKVREYCGFRID